MPDTEPAARAIEDTFVLADQSYVYTEQDWSQAPGAAAAAFQETRNVYWTYMGALLARTPVVEAGRNLDRSEVKARAIELVGGLFALAPHASITIPLVKRAVNGLLLIGGVPIAHDL